MKVVEKNLKSCKACQDICHSLYVNIDILCVVQTGVCHWPNLHDFYGLITSPFRNIL